MANSAYEDDLDVNKPLTPNSQSPNKDVQLGGAGGHKESPQNIHNAYDEDMAPQANQNQNAAPPPPHYCVRVINWFPIRYASWIGGIVLLVGLILDFIFNKDAFVQFLLRIYLLVFALIIIIVEAPHIKLVRKWQLSLYFWFRILSRMWGRGSFYLFVTFLCFAEFNEENPGEFTVIAGFYLAVITLASFLYARLAAAKYNRLFEFIAAGAEGDELKINLSRKWDELAASNREQKVGSYEISDLAKQAGRDLSNAERHAVQSYLDERCNGFVTKEDWMKQFLRLKTEKQRFL